MDQSLFIVFFIYGLAFFAMGLATAMEAGRPSVLAEARVLRPLAGFGLIHGTHEWLDSYILQADSLGTPLPDWLPWLRLGLLVSSFLSLLLFAFQALRLVHRPLQRSHRIMVAALILYLAFILLSAIFTYQHAEVPWQNVVDALARYLLAVPASMLAAMGLRARSRQTRDSSHHLSTNLNSASLGFGLYAFTQLFVHQISMFPADLINQESFVELMGFPIQAVRTVMAIIITISLVRSTQAADEIRQKELFSAQQARLDALEEQETLRRELLRHTVRAQEDERARIARELHDETAQTLSAFTLELASLRNDKVRKTDARKTVERLQSLSQDMSRGLYRLVHDLRPAQLDDLGLVPALRFLIGQECCPLGLSMDFEVEGVPRRLDQLVETVLFRVGQEALTNLVRHAQVQEGNLKVIYAADQVTLCVSDRGRGFDPAQNFRPPHGWGLAGMKERVESVGGILHIESAPGRGTTIEVRVPLDGQEQS